MSLCMRSHPSPCLEFQAQHDLGPSLWAQDLSRQTPARRSLGKTVAEGRIVGEGCRVGGTRRGLWGVPGPCWRTGTGLWPQPAPGKGTAPGSAPGWAGPALLRLPGLAGPSADELTRSFFRVVTISLPVRLGGAPLPLWLSTSTLGQPEASKYKCQWLLSRGGLGRCLATLLPVPPPPCPASWQEEPPAGHTLWKVQFVASPGGPLPAVPSDQLSPDLPGHRTLQGPPPHKGTKPSAWLHGGPEPQLSSACPGPLR